jgi:hypothetical protein
MCVELARARGAPTHPRTGLLPGAGISMDWWEVGAAQMVELGTVLLEGQ